MQKTKQRRAVLGKVLIAAIACLLMVSGMILSTGAEVVFPKDAAPTTVYLDGREVLQNECVILQSITYVPLRNFCNLFEDCKITWNAKTSTATVKTDDLTMTVQSGAIYITANGHYYYTVGEVRNLNGHLYVPIRPLAKAFAAELNWNASARRTELKSAANGRNAVAWANYKSDEVYWLSRIISAEAKGEPFEGQIAVGNVVLNRVRSSRFPNTIAGVIYQDGAFDAVRDGQINLTPNEQSRRAARDALNGWDPTGGCLYYYNPATATSKWIWTREVRLSIGDHSFAV